MKNKKKVSIAGGTGYTAGELIRILKDHPNVEITAITSTSSVGDYIYEYHRDLIGETNIRFTDSPDQDSDIIFLCLGHGISERYIRENNIPEKCKIIDLGNDFRLGTENFIYGLPELNREKVRNSDKVANPGCFATAIQLAILPVIKEITGEVHIHALTGSTGAGKSPSDTTHFSYRESNISVYKPFTHQHLKEVYHNIWHGEDTPQINFIPMRGDFTRGIFASIYFKVTDPDIDRYKKIYDDYYAKHPFVFLSECPISLKEVVNTNKALLHLDMHQGYLHITSIIDNLIKGASGQAVQNMNLMFGWDEKSGLNLKGSAF